MTVNSPEADSHFLSSPRRDLVVCGFRGGSTTDSETGSTAMKIPALLFTVMFTRMLTAAELSPPAEAANALGLDLYRLEGAKTTGNLLLSPYSIQSALCMTLGGADGNTK